MLNNSECYFYGLSKSVFLNSEWWYILPIFTILSKQKKNQKKHKIWFSESLFPKVHLEKGGYLIIRVILYTGQSCIILTVVLLLSPCPGDSVSS